MRAGTGVAFVAPLNSYGGILSFSLDGVTQGTVDVYRPSDGAFYGFTCSQVLYRSPTLINGAHKLEITRSGPSPGQTTQEPYVNMEYFT
jgi:hypothetical protein